MSDDFYRALEDRFRASQDEISSRLGGYRPFLQGLRALFPQPRAFDIGCGRGEWLQLLNEQGFDAQGVDLDDSMLAACHQRGLRVENKDALTALGAMPDEALELVSAIHVVEHLDFDYLRQLLVEAHRTLSPGGLLILETPNSENLMVGTSSFYLDPTHHRPVPALFLEFLCQFSGFGRVKVVRLQEDPALHGQDAAIGLWQVLYGVSPDYALVAQKQPVGSIGDDPLKEVFAETYGLDLATLAARHDQRVERLHQSAMTRISDLDLTVETQSQAVEAQSQRLAELMRLYERSCERAEQVEAELRQIYSSRSWRITRPIRDVADTLRHMDRAGLKRYGLEAVQRPLRAAFFYLRRKPAVMAAASRVCRTVPGLERRLQRLASTLARPTQSQLQGQQFAYSPRVIQLQRRLVQLQATGGQQQQGRLFGERPWLAYVSPLPPERTGIADYSAELLPALAQYYRIELIVEQTGTSDEGVKANYPLRDAGWLREHAGKYDAVLYHIGNSSFHHWMYSLLEDVPGIVVLHDFYLSGLIWSLAADPEYQGIKLQELYHSHGYPALAEGINAEDERQIAFRYPFNRSVLERAKGVIVHSDVSLRLARQWYGADAGADWACVPLLRVPAEPGAVSSMRAELDLPQDAFVVCSFGMLGETKLNHRLLEAWLSSELASASNTWLVFVGELGQDAYARQLNASIAAAEFGARIRITGWADGETFRHYLAAADLAVQLRGLSRGETSAAVLDCMNHGLATIVNDNGSMADLPADGVYHLPDAFETAELRSALEHFWKNAEARSQLGERARTIIHEQHAPAQCAQLYRDAIEGFVARDTAFQQVLVDALHAAPVAARTDQGLLDLASRLVHRQPTLRQRQVLIDITATAQLDRHTGIERVARALTLALLQTSAADVRIEPVYLKEDGGRWHYRSASAYVAGLLGIESVIPDQGIDFSAGDQLIALDVSGQTFIRASEDGLFRQMQQAGVVCRMLLHDLLPVTKPEFFPPQAQRHFTDWLNKVAELDGAICVSNTVAGELRSWMQEHHGQRVAAFRFDYSHHGADLACSAPSRGMPDDAEHVLGQVRARPSLLMVGTLEPRKGHLQALQAFTRLWREGVDVNLLIVGREGWTDLPDDQRRNIPQLMAQLRQHHELGKRLFWLDGISDEYLEQIYSSADGLLAASEDEGFGLPLIESAQKGLPVLARDIPIFREVAGDHARYFRAAEPGSLADAIQAWVLEGFKPSSQQLPWLTWRQSAANLKNILLAEHAGPVSQGRDS